MSRDAEETGRVLTKSFMFQGEDLYVNIDAKWCDIRVKIVEAEADISDGPVGLSDGPDILRPLPGYGRNEPVPLSGDHVRVKLQWG